MNNTNISYKIKRSKRAKKLRILVQCEAVVVTAPLNLGDSVIAKFVREKLSWIEKTLERLKNEKKNWEHPDGVRQESYAACQARAKKFIRDKVIHHNQYYGFSYNRIAVKRLKSRWGSCSSKKNLNFHYRLLFLPVELADYVIVHELCHLEEMNHSKKFWNLVEKKIPDYTERRKELSKYIL